MSIPGKFAGLVAGLLLMVIATASAHAQSEPEQQVSEAVQQVIEDQLQAFGAGDHQRAYSHASPSIRKIFPTTDRFIDMVRSGYEVLYSSKSHIFGRNISISGQIHQEVIVTGPEGKQWQAVYTLRQQEDGSWKITGVKLEPYKGAAV